MTDKSGKNTGTFIVKIVERRNCTWQGSVTWAEKRQVQNFRSALELLKMIDGALDANSDENEEVEGGNHEK